MTETTIAAVVKTVTVKANLKKTFRVFTEEMDTWWPKTHHMGQAPMKRTIVEGRVGGRCYSEQTDGTECDWARVTVWEPPTRFVMAWQITPQWGYEPDLSKASEVEVRFTALDGLTRVDLEHRHFERHGEGAEGMRTQVNSTGGWGALLQLFAERTEAE